MPAIVPIAFSFMQPLAHDPHVAPPARSTTACRHSGVPPGVRRSRRQTITTLRPRGGDRASVQLQAWYFGEPPPPPWWQRQKTWLIALLAVAALAAFVQLKGRRRRKKARKKRMMMEALEFAMSKPSQRSQTRAKPKASEVEAPPPQPASTPAASAPPPSAPAAAVPSEPQEASTAAASSPVAAASTSDTPAAPEKVTDTPAPEKVTDTPAAPEKVVAETPSETDDASDGSEMEASSSSATAVASEANVENVEKAADGRRIVKCEGDSAAAAIVVAEVASAARAAIQERGAFSIAVSGDDAADSLAALAKESDLDFSAFHVFFCYDKLGKLPCYEQVQDALKKCNIPSAQVHAVSSDALADGTGAAAQYTANMCMQEENVILEGDDGLPSMDLVLLSTRDDGTVGGLVPGSLAGDDVHSGQVIMPAQLDGESALALTIDGINAAKRAIVLAAKPSRKEMVEKALSSTPDVSVAPASEVKASDTLWLVPE